MYKLVAATCFPEQIDTICFLAIRKQRLDSCVVNVNPVNYLCLNNSSMSHFEQLIMTNHKRSCMKNNCCLFVAVLTFKQEIHGGNYLLREYNI